MDIGTPEQPWGLFYMDIQQRQEQLQRSTQALQRLIVSYNNAEDNDLRARIVDDTIRNVAQMQYIIQQLEPLYYQVTIEPTKSQLRDQMEAASLVSGQVAPEIKTRYRYLESNNQLPTFGMF